MSPLNSSTQFSVSFNLVWREDELDSAIVVVNDRVLTATRDHPNFARIVEVLRNSEVEGEPLSVDVLTDLFDAGRALQRRFTRLSQRVSVNNSRLFLDGDPMEDDLASAIIRLYMEGLDDFTALVAFLEKVTTNPNEHSRTQLFRWMSKHRFGLTFDGDLIAYKGVLVQGDTFVSSTSGTAWVNGVEYQGRIPNIPGTIVEMPRSEVVWDPREGCSTGLHVANWSFARSFACLNGKVLKVQVNPRDVVSVPTDSGDQKMRVCRYRILGVVEAEDTAVLYAASVIGEGKTRYIPSTPQQVVVTEAEQAPVSEDLLHQIASDNVVAEQTVIPAGTVKRLSKANSTTFPAHYEEFSRRHWRLLDKADLVKAAKVLDVDIPVTASREKYITVLHQAARTRKATYEAQAAAAKEA